MIRYRGISIDRSRRCIQHNGGQLHLPPKMFELASALLLAGPKTNAELIELIYGNHEDGGPLSAERSVWVMLTLLRRQFAAIGIVVISMRHLSCNRYWAEPEPEYDASLFAEAAE